MPDAEPGSIRHAKPSSSCAPSLFVMHRHISRAPNSPALSRWLRGREQPQRQRPDAERRTVNCRMLHLVPTATHRTKTHPRHFTVHLDHVHQYPGGSVWLTSTPQGYAFNRCSFLLRQGYGGQESDRTTTHKLPPTTPPASSHLLRKPRAARAPGPYTKASGGKKTRAMPATTLKTPPDRSCGNPMPPHLRTNNSAPREAANCRHRQPLLRGCEPRPPLRRPAVPSAAVVISPPF